jgi:hypothetical protein
MVEFQKTSECHKDGQILNQGYIELRCSIIIGTFCAPRSKIVVFGKDNLGNGRHGTKKHKLQSKELTLQKNGISKIVIILVGISLATKEETKGWGEVISPFSQYIHDHVPIAFPQHCNAEGEEL